MEAALVQWFVEASTRLSVTDPWTSLWILALALVIAGSALASLPRDGREPRAADARDAAEALERTSRG